MTTQQVGLRSRIERARSLKEIQTLLAEGDKFEHATAGTQRRWQKAGAQRGAELGKQTAAAYKAAKKSGKKEALVAA